MNEPYDPLRLCVFATIALLAWVVGPAVVVAFAGVGLAAYATARRKGLQRSKCKLGDVRLVMAYLGVVALAGLAGVVLQVRGWLT
jgi:hypothetical protein